MRTRFHPSPRGRRARLSWLLAGALAVACGSSPTPRFWAIESLEDGTAPAGFRQLGVAVGPVSVPRYLERPQIVRRRGDSSLVYGEFDRWGGSLESDLLRVLGENLGVLLETDRIVVYPRRAPFPMSYRVRIDFERFEGVGGEELLLKARWVIASGDDGEALAVETTSVREPLDGGSVQELVRAHGAALAELSRTLAARIRELESGRARAGDEQP